MKTYTIIPLMDKEYVKEVCIDVAEQIRNGIAQVPLFMMPLVPEGNPVRNKAEEMCAIYREYRDELREYGIECGILVQSSMGHAHNGGTDELPMQHFVNLTDGKETVFCPYDKAFREYFKSVMSTIARQEPCEIMLDDDFRMMAYRPGKACACPLHMKRFNELAQTELTREELYDILCQHTDEARKFKEIFIKTQGEAVIEAATIMREGIDSVNPSIPGSYCCCGNNAEFAYEIATALAGENNPTVVRINNGNYCNAGNRGIASSVSFRAASQCARLNEKVDYILAETDTCPQNRYSTSASVLHTNYVASLLEGTVGAKQWITRLHAYEPKSGAAYRKILSKNQGMYEELIKLVPKLKWTGCNIPIVARPVYDFNLEYSDGWFGYALERLGLPIYFSNSFGDTVFLDDFSDEYFTDEEIKELLSKTIFLTGDAALRLCKKGYGKYLGVDVKEEYVEGAANEWLPCEKNECEKQNGLRKIVPLSDGVNVDSYARTREGECISPAVVTFENSLGGNIIVFGGTPKGKFNISEGFSFLNESRKKQLIRLIEKYNKLPTYYPGDAEIYLRCAEIKDGGICCALFNTGIDTLEEIELVTDIQVSHIEYLKPDGTKGECKFTVKDRGLHIELELHNMNPTILFLS